MLMCAFLDSLANRLFWSSKDAIPQEQLFGCLLEGFTSFGPQWNLVSLPDFYDFLLWARDWAMGLFMSGLKLSPDAYALKKDLQSGGIDFERNECIDRGERIICDALNMIHSLINKQGIYLVSKKEFELVMIKMICPALHNTMQKFTLKSLLYRNYRCKAIHEWVLLTNTQSDKFWTEEEIYFDFYKPDPLAYSEEKLLGIVFPIRFIWRMAFEIVQQLRDEFLDYLLTNYNEIIESPTELVWDLIADAIARKKFRSLLSVTN